MAATWEAVHAAQTGCAVTWLSPRTLTTALKGGTFDWPHFIDKKTEGQVGQRYPE